MAEEKVFDLKKRYSGQNARQYDKRRSLAKKWKREESALRQILPKGKKVLDVPFGTGRFIDLYREYSITFVGMDTSEDMLSEALKKDSHLDVCIADITNIPLPDKSVDIAVCIRLLNLIPESSFIVALRELARVSREGIILTVRLKDKIEYKKKSVSQRNKVFESVTARMGWYASATIDINDDDYKMVKLEPFDA